MQQETFLPVFPGFYSTIFEPEMIEAEEREYLSLDCLEDEDFNYGWAADAMVKCIEDKLRDEGYEMSVHFQQLMSPREYNFRNDSIDVIIDFTEDDLKKIRQCLIKNIDEFSQYLKDNYTSYDGFISSHSTIPDEWVYTFHKDKHKLGAVLNFLLQFVHYYDESDLHNDLTYFGEHMYYFERVKPEFQEILDQIDRYIRENYLHTDREMMAKALFTNFGENVGYECTFDPDFFMHLVNKVYNEIEDKVGKLF